MLQRFFSFFATRRTESTPFFLAMLPDRLGGAENMKSVLATGRRLSRGDGGRGGTQRDCCRGRRHIEIILPPFPGELPLNVVRSTVDNFLPLYPPPPWTWADLESPCSRASSSCAVSCP